MAEKKLKKAGDRVIWRLREDESPEIIDWLNHQTNISDAIRLLIEKDVLTYGTRRVFRDDETLSEKPIEPYTDIVEANIDSVGPSVQSPPPDYDKQPDSHEGMKKKKRKRRIMV